MNKKGLVALVNIIFFSFIFFTVVNAQDMGDLTLSITPPLIKNNVSPGQVWRSAIKVVNNNAVAVEVYTEVVDFRSNNENGKVEFIRDQGQLDLYKNHLLSQWVDIDSGPYSITPGQSADIPFTVVVPETADPGGHYAAILVGTKPPVETGGGSSIKVSSQLASLILLRINGEEKEEGQIREFSTSEKFYFNPRVNFKLRFENTGNVHLLPRGEIRVENIFGEEKGTIKLNHNTEFGNVLPEGIRAWNFEWQSEKGLSNMGRYRATLVLSYGEKASETIEQVLYFWVVYPKVLLITVGSVLFIVLLIIFFVRRYIRKSILMTQAQLGLVAPSAGGGGRGTKVMPAINDDKFFKARVKAGASSVSIPETAGGWDWLNLKKLLAVIVAAIIILSGLLFYLYFQGDSAGRLTEITENPAPAENQEASEVLIVNQEDGGQTSTSAPVKIVPETEKSEPAAAASLTVKVLNGSGTPGLAGIVAKKLEDKSYNIRETGNADNFDYTGLTIRYKKGREAEAEAMGKIFNIKTTLVETEETDVDLVVIAGRGYED